jgi:hypothetical protein
MLSFEMYYAENCRGTAETIAPNMENACGGSHFCQSFR